MNKTGSNWKVEVSVQDTEWNKGGATLDFNKKYNFTQKEVDKMMKLQKWSGVRGMFHTLVIEMAFKDGLKLDGAMPIFNIIK
jgi:hypothetical protein